MLNTTNAHAITGGANPLAGNTHEVEILIGTYIKSVGRDVKPGAVVTISNDDYRFLKPYGYCKDVTGEVVVEAPVNDEETTDEETTDEEVTEETTDEEVTEETAAPKVEGKRKSNR